MRKDYVADIHFYGGCGPERFSVICDSYGELVKSVNAELLTIRDCWSTSTETYIIYIDKIEYRYPSGKKFTKRVSKEVAEVKDMIIKGYDF